MKSSSKIAQKSLAFLLLLAGAACSGCETKEKVLDIETPNGGVEVERSLDSGEVDIEIKD